MLDNIPVSIAVICVEIDNLFFIFFGETTYFLIVTLAPGRMKHICTSFALPPDPALQGPMLQTLINVPGIAGTNVTNKAILLFLCM
jgi:hypothetical protein